MAFESGIQARSDPAKLAHEIQSIGKLRCMRLYRRVDAAGEVRIACKGGSLSLAQAPGLNSHGLCHTVGRGETPSKQARDSLSCYFGGRHVRGLHGACQVPGG